MSQTAKIFKNGRSQAVRLPAEFRFNTDEVFIRRDAKTGDVVLSVVPEPDRKANWDSFLKARAEANVPDDFLSPAERDQGKQRPDPFEGWEE